MSSTDVRNPATAEVVATVPAATEAEVDAAIERGALAYPAWRSVAPGDRARLLRRFADLVDSYGEELAQLEVLNAGHVVSNARWEAGNVRDVLEYYAAAPERQTGRQIPVAGGVDLTFHEPLGVVGVIVPWNFPMAIAGWGFAPALAAGNTVVVKPAELTPLSALRLGELAREAGLPEGVLQVVAGKGSVVGWRLVTHPAVRKVCFTGSTEIGRRIMAGCAEQVKRVTLELGGKSANIVFADADLEVRRGARARGRLRQRRAGLLRPLADPRRAPGLRAFPRPPGARRRSGPGRRPRERDERDGPVDLRGTPPGRGGVRPRERADRRPRPRARGPRILVPPDGAGPRRRARPAVTEEIFGPVVVVVPFEDEADAVRIANDTEFGLSGSIWTRDVGRALRVARAVETGNLSVNSHSSVRYWTPFGGVKQSGIGRELGPDALDAFTDVKNVFIATGD